jgi:Holliday junction resolvase-like predicted endonuclease
MSSGLESDWFHPLVRSWLEERGYQVEHEVKMPLYGRADFVARTKKTTLIIECKVVVSSLSATLRQVRD